MGLNIQINFGKPSFDLMIDDKSLILIQIG